MVTEGAGQVRCKWVVKSVHYHFEHINDPDLSEYFVPVEWLHTVPVEQAIKEVGMFGNQNTVFRPITPKWRWTIERLKHRFQISLE